MSELTAVPGLMYGDDSVPVPSYGPLPTDKGELLRFADYWRRRALRAEETVDQHADELGYNNISDLIRDRDYHIKQSRQCGATLAEIRRVLPPHAVDLMLMWMEGKPEEMLRAYVAILRASAPTPELESPTA